jgi:hypothetical protein
MARRPISSVLSMPGAAGSVDESEPRQISGISTATFPSPVRRRSLQSAARSLSGTRALSLEAMSNRPSARIKAHSLTWGGAAVPHCRKSQSVSGCSGWLGCLGAFHQPCLEGWIKAGIDIRSCQFDCDRSSISGDHVLCPSPQGIF